MRRRAPVGAAGGSTQSEKAAVEQLLREPGPLDVLEQQRVVAYFDECNRRWESGFRAVFAAVSTLLAAVFAYLAMVAHTLHFDFGGVGDGGDLLSVGGSSGGRARCVCAHAVSAALLVASAVMVARHCPAGHAATFSLLSLVRSPVVLSLGPTVFWLAHLPRGWGFAELALAAWQPLFHLGALHSLRSLDDLHDGVAALKRSTYSHEKV